MSNNWDQVKGFFRRKTQKFTETYRNASKTTDPVVDQNVATVMEFQKRIRSLHSNMNGLGNALNQTLAMMDAVKDDLAALGAASVENLTEGSKCLEMAVRDMRSKLENLQGQFAKDTESRVQFDKDCERLKAILEERKTTMLEYDFFRNKVAALREKPPADTARIPRNEARLDDWGKQYDTQTEKVKQLCQQLIGGGARLSTSTGATIMGETGRFFDESGRTCRAVLLGQGLSQSVAHAMAAAQATAQIPQQVSAEATAAARQAAQAAALAAQKQQAASTTPTEPRRTPEKEKPSESRQSFPAEPRSSQRFGGGGDDPFKV